MKNPLLEEIEKAILESAGLPEYKNHLGYLRNSLNDLGYNFPETRKGEKDAYKEARKLWWEIREQKQPIDEFPITDLDDLPATKVKIGSREYFIHGVIHGIRGISDSVKQFVGTKAIDYSCQYESELFVESGLRKAFDMCIGADFKDYQILSSKDRAIEHYLLLPLLPVSIILNQFSSKERLQLKIYNKAIKDIRYLPKSRELGLRNRLPEPLFMESISNVGFLRKGVTERSKFMANEMIQGTSSRISGMNIKETHAIVGLGHEDQIAYFLINS